MEQTINNRRGRYALSLVALAALLVVATPASDATGADNTKADVPMTCFPAPGAPTIPPCIVPAGLDPGMLDGTSGNLRLAVANDGSTDVVFRAEGLDPDWVVTAWVSYYFPGPGVMPPDPIFGTGAVPGVAGVSAPVAPTTAAFTEGLGIEPNQMVVNPNGKSVLKIDLDYNPLEAGQGPLRNTLSNTQQADAPAGSPAEQPLCCLGKVQAVGSSYLRSFDANGFQVLNEIGVPELVRSPVPVAFMLLIIHTDGMTHGINPGLPIFPFPGVPAAAGDHYVLGIFDLSDL
jgi:hypothetical protein